MQCTVGAEVGAEETLGAWLVVGCAVGVSEGRKVGAGEVVGISVIVGADDGVRHVTNVLNTQSVGSLTEQSPSVMAPQQEYGSDVGQAVQAPSSRSAG